MSTVVLVLIGVFVVVLAVLWVLLPIAVFGIKELLTVLVTEQRKTNALLAKAVQQVRDDH